MLEIKYTTQFKKDFKKISKNNKYNLDELKYVIKEIANKMILPEKYKNHSLNGIYTRIL